MMGTDQHGRRPDRAAIDPIAERSEELARAAVAIQFERWPALYERYGEAGRDKCVQDLRYHILYLAEAAAAGSPVLFRDYAGWVKVLFAGIGIPAEELAESLEILRDVIAARVDGPAAEQVRACVDEALAALPALPSEAPSHMAADGPFAAMARAYLEALLGGDRRRATSIVMDAVEGGMAVADVYRHVFQPTLREVGRLWQTGAVTVAHEHFATAATQAAMSLLYPRIFAAERCGRALVATCVSGEMHEVGIRMVTDCFEMAGWDTYYLGANTPARSIVRAVEERGAQVLAVSATITPHVGAVADLIAAVRTGTRAGPAGRPPLRILVGGHPFAIDPDLWRSVGADACALDAGDAVAAANALLANSSGEG